MAFDRVTVAAVLDPDQPLLDADATVSAAARAMRRCGTDAVVIVDAERMPRGVQCS